MTIGCTITTVLTVVVALFTGCRGMGTQRFAAFAPSQSHELAKSCRIVLDVRCTNVTARADYNLWENLHMLAPMPKRWKFDLTLQVERLVQGKFTEPSLHVHWLREPTSEQSEELGIVRGAGLGVFTNGMPLRIGFDSFSDNRLRNLSVMVRYD